MIKESVIIKVHNITKVYKLYNKPFDRVKESLSPFKRQYHNKFYALKNVSFELKKGEALGIIGKNGNGKSTLLKIISGVLTPTSGYVKAKGRISAILELTSGLKPELTGIQNIELNLKINGIKRKDISKKVKEIEEFAELGEFINQPIKTYSSGMRARLGFGIATSSEPDILILDEVLAVGDFNFQQKCLAKINEMRDRISMIFVSHSMNSVRLFCDRVIVLEQGKLAFDGKTDDAITYYLEQEEKKKLKEKSTKPIKPFYGDIFYNKNKITDVYCKWNKNVYNLGELMILEISFKLLYKPKNLVVGIPIWTKSGNMITGIATDISNYEVNVVPNEICTLVLKLKNVFNPEYYISILSIYDGAEALYRGLTDGFVTKNNTSRYFGYVTLESKWSKKC